MKCPYSLIIILSTLLFNGGYCQPPATKPNEIKKGLLQKNTMTDSSITRRIPFENIGPSIMSGRVVDLDVNPQNPIEFYVAYASGGVWYTHNNGTTFDPVLDSAPTLNVGDIAIDWKKRTIWVGTGENNSSRSSYAGIGILKSTDRGKTWEHMGLGDSHHIGRIVINPKNPKEVVVGVIGHLYSPNQERGVFKTVDGGKTWKKTLFINEHTGIIDIAHAPGDFQTLYAAAWDRDRKAWNFRGNGIGSGIYKSTDSGTTWKKISEGTTFPNGEGVGRIGLAVYDQNTVYAVLDNQNRREKEKEEDPSTLKKDDFRNMSVQQFLDLENKILDRYLNVNKFPEKYKAGIVKKMIRNGEVEPVDLADYLEDANTLLFDTPVVGAEVFRSNDGGKTWNKTHPGYLDDMFFSYGYYFAQIQINPQNPEHIYISGVPILKSKDGGKSFHSINAKNVHADHHALWINPQNPVHLINGNDGGVNISYDDGKNWIKANQPSVGQFYAINVDHEKPYNVYGGLQDNGVWVGSIKAKENEAWHQTGQYPWKSIMGGDGMQVQIDRRNSNTVYTGYQYGNYFRLDRIKGEQESIQPKHDLGEKPYRFNWQTPILLSSHNQDIIYLGANMLLRSMNRGDDWTEVSKDLTTGGKKGNVAYGTITAIAESPFRFGMLYTGSDDGLVYFSPDSGESWNDISEGLPKNLWVSRVVASSHKRERVYVSLNGYRWDDFSPYLYVSNDNGKTWKHIGNSLPLSPINVIVEDPGNENILYTGTDNGAYVSLDQGKSWNAFKEGLPNVAVHDMVIQQEAKDLLIGTHGRSIYKAGIAPLQELDEKILKSPIHVFDVDTIDFSEEWGNSWSKWLDPFEEKVQIPFFTKDEGRTVIKVLSKGGKELQQFEADAIAGINYASYDLSITKNGRERLLKEFPDNKIPEKTNQKYYLPVGTYHVEIIQGKNSHKTVMGVE